MSATIEIAKQYGASPGTEGIITGLALKSVDDATTTGPNAPITIPTSGTSYSYESWLRFKCTAAPDNEVGSFKIWGSGSAIQSGAFVITVNTDSVTSYATPVNTESEQGTRADLADHGSASKISVGGTLDAEGEYTDFVVLQAEVTSSALPGNVAQQTIYYEYTET